MKQDKTKFFSNSAYFISILISITILLCSFPFYVFWKSGEFYLTDDVILNQQSSNELILFGPAYSNPDKYFKLHSAKFKQNEVIVLGTSRVMQFRDQFMQNASFYNAGAAVSRISHFKYFLDQIPDDRKPKIIIIGLDQYFFNPNWENGQKENPELIFSENENRLMRFRDSIVKIYVDSILDKIDINNLEKPKRIGLNAIVNDNGFRNDGSYYYGKEIMEGGVNSPSHWDYKFMSTMNRINQGANRFQYGRDISTSSLEELDKFLNASKSRSIHIIGFLPPYASEIWKELESRNEDYSYMFKLNSTLSPIFAKYDFSFYDFSDLKDLKADNCEILDGFHGSEKAYSRIVLHMAKNDRIIARFVNISRLDAMIKKSENCFQI